MKKTVGCRVVSGPPEAFFLSLCFIMQIIHSIMCYTFLRIFTDGCCAGKYVIMESDKTKNFWRLALCSKIILTQNSTTAVHKNKHTFHRALKYKNCRYWKFYKYCFIFFMHDTMVHYLDMTCSFYYYHYMDAFLYVKNMANTS